MFENKTNHHITKRKKEFSHDKTFPNSDKIKNTIDKTCILFSVLMPATTIPQIYSIYMYQVVDGLSLLMWILYSIGVIPFLLYGIIHKEKPLIILNILWLIAQITIITGIIIYS